MRRTIQRTSFIFIFFILCLAAPFILSAGTGDGTVVSVTKIQDNGPDNQKFNIIIMGDGYQTAELATFENRAAQVVAAFNSQIAWSPCSNGVNFYRVNISSTDSGVDKPAACYSPAVLKDTYLDCEYCGDGSTDRCIWSSNISLVYSTASAATTHWDYVVVLVNDAERGGCAGGSLTFNSTGAGFTNIVLHELGHAIGDLADEYEEFNHTYTGGEPSEANLTKETNRGNLKWRDLVLETTPIPTWNKTDCTAFSTPPAAWNGIVGTYEGGGRNYTCGIYRPQPDCMMSSTDFPFCAVCTRRLQQVLMLYNTGGNLTITPWGAWQTPPTSPYWQTPDIWCDNNGNGIQEPNEPLIGKSDNHLFAKISNIGNAASDPYQVRFSYVPFTGVIDLSNEQLIHVASRPALGAGLTDTVEVLWDLTSIPPAFAGVDHFCVIVEIIADECAKYDNKAQNNFGSVQTTGPSPAPFSLYIKNITNEDAVGALIIEPAVEDWQISANVPDIKNIPLAKNEEKLITIEFKYTKKCTSDDDDSMVVRKAGKTSEICATQDFDITYQLNGQTLGGVSSQVIVYPAPDESEKKYGLSFHAGLTFPLGSLRVPYISGGMFGIDLEYDLTQQLTLMGLFGYNYFNSELDILEDTYWWNLSLNLKYKFSTTNSRPFINGGLGLYFPKSGGFPKSGSTRPGFNIGVGYNYILSPTLVGEIGVNYHHAFYPGDDLEFLVSYCGLIYRF